LTEEFFLPPELITCVKNARHVAVLTGAGVSAESGVPTFRDKLAGLWARYRAEDLSSVEAFQRDPALVWRWHTWLADQMEEALPNAGHFALAEWQNILEDFTLITQNIDGLHQRAGSQGVLELHGNIHRVICSQEGTVVGPRDGSDASATHCPRCGAWLRHDVVWFGENLPEQILQAAEDASRKCDLFVTIGTSAVVQPAASLPLLARRAGAVVVEINPHATALSPVVSYSVRGPSARMLPYLLARLR
jgi:NAD-dependent deacetylase